MFLAETLVVTNDEPCFLLEETVLQSPGNRGWHRYQVLTVVRDDRLAQAKIDLGPRALFDAPGFRVLGGVHDPVTGRIEILHTVGELRDLAEFQRVGLLPAPEHLTRPSDLLGQYHDYRNRRRKARRRVSTFGPGGQLQRCSWWN